MDAEGGEVAIGTLNFFVTSQRAVVLLWALLTGPRAHIGCIGLA